MKIFWKNLNLGLGRKAGRELLVADGEGADCLVPNLPPPVSVYLSLLNYNIERVFAIHLKIQCHLGGVSGHGIVGLIVC